MRYSLLKVLRNQIPESTEYKIPIIGHQEIYNRIENLDTATRIILLDGRSEGYDSITYFYQEICKMLGFNPFMLKKKFYINTRGIEYGDGMEVALINAFSGEYEEWNNNQANFYPMEATQANILGYTYLASGYSTSQASLGQTPYGLGGDYSQVFNNIIRPKQHDSYIGIEYMFEIWPETAIQSGYIDTQHFYRDEGQIKAAHVSIEVWYNSDTQKYHYTVYLACDYYSQGLTDYVDNNLNQAELDKVYNPENPFDNKQSDGDDGGDQESDDGSDPVEVPDLPTLDVSDLGGFNLYKVSAQDVKSLFSYLNSHDPGEAILKWIQNPIQGIISLHVLPYPVEVPSGSGNSITVLGMDTGVAGYKVAPYQMWKLGGVRVPYGFDNTFLDYEPFTRVSIYLPFIGIRPLDTDEVMGQAVDVTYQFDNISGACIAFVTVNDSVRYSYVGSCAMGLPISQQNWGQTYIAAATVAAGALAGGIGAAAGAAGQGVASMLGNGVAGAVQGAGGMGALNIPKPTISRSGSISGAGAALGVNHPYLIIERPTKASAANPAPVTGLVSGRTLSLGSLSGYNIIESVHLSGVPATASELDEIERLLYQGVVF
jgi:hypothetical protein